MEQKRARRGFKSTLKQIRKDRVLYLLLLPTIVYFTIEPNHACA